VFCERRLAGMKTTQVRDRFGKRARRSRAEWVEEVQRWRRSGQSAAEYAEAHDLDQGTLAGWSSRLRRESSAPALRERTGQPGFLAVRVTDVSQHKPPPTQPVVMIPGGLEVVLVNGRSIRISGDFDPSRVGRLIEIAEGGARC
jgi:transposase